MLRNVALVRTNVLEERSASIIRVTKISDLRTTLYSSETSVLTRTTLCNIPENSILQSHHCENLTNWSCHIFSYRVFIMVHWHFHRDGLSYDSLLYSSVSSYKWSCCSSVHSFSSLFSISSIIPACYLVPVVLNLASLFFMLWEESSSLQNMTIQLRL
jgi:hypothetical protein